ncbi:MAG: tetratricopeptide repeat protein [Nitrospirae bacterium]|uniref:tetratricopeptide repeat protein n=1 Tax=Candidatus Magnetobacterium casense TaxID=1455061 RepID=UPI0006974301|nr:tetratricopeptide repeat protein [Candidatus Magnetobacterium casensis]MBF0336893.1 tetratricopeptide repeat protein [Nitrospirota bacterium]
MNIREKVEPPQDKQGGILTKDDTKSIVLVLLLLTLVVYYRVGFNDFINCDDPQYVTDNHMVNTGLSVDGMLWAFKTTFFVNWHPLTWLSHMLDVSVFRLNPGGHHLTNLIIHMINTVLVFYVLLRMTAERWRSAFVAAMFAVHPLTVESVAWVSERKNVLCTMFWLLTMIAYHNYVRQDDTDTPSHKGRGIKIRIYMLVLLLFALALMAKPMAVTLPFVLILMDVWPLKRFTYPRIAEKIPLFVLSGISSMITYVVQREAHAVQPLSMLPLANRVFTATVNYVQYLYMMINPTKLAIFYPYPYNMPLWKPCAAFALLLVITIYALVSGPRRPYLIIGWLWYVGTMVPVIKLVQTGREAIADRYTYVPLIGIYIIMAWGSAELLQNSRFKKPVLTIIAAVLIVFYGSLTWAYTGHWKNSLTLFKHAIDAVENNYQAYNNYGNALIDNDRLGESIGYFARGIELKPDSAELRGSMGDALTRQGKFEEAMIHYVRSQPLMFFDGEALLRKRFGLIYLKRKNYKDAVIYLNKSLDIHPRDTEVLNNLGIALMGLDRVKEAVDAFTRAVDIAPQSASMHKNLAYALRKAGRDEEAQAHMLQAQRLGGE